MKETEKIRRRKKMKILSTLKAPGSEHFEKGCGLEEGRRVSNAEGIKLKMTSF